MRFRNHNALRSFILVAKYNSFTEAAKVLNRTKGAVSHQIDQLEQELGFKAFARSKKGIQLTDKGNQLLRTAERAFGSIEQEIDHLRRHNQNNITIGMATYFASRWLSPKLMHFITAHPDIGLRIQPLVGTPDLHANGLDMVIRWGKGYWQDKDMTIEQILPCPAMLTASKKTGEKIKSEGLSNTIGQLNLLHDADGSQAWKGWFDAAKIKMQPVTNDLVIPDPNVRVQAVIDDQGIALYDQLVDDEVKQDKLYRHTSIQLHDYGYYLVYPENTELDSPTKIFRDWIMQEAAL